MKLPKHLLMTLFSLFAVVAQANPLMNGFTITEIGEHRYDAILDSAEKTQAQFIVDHCPVTGFQSEINMMVKYRASVGERTWRDAFQTYADVLRMYH